jgi:hydroxycarboxylate dehydrogenase B
VPTFDSNELKQFAGRLLMATGASAEEADTVADVLVSANLAGHDSHGVIRIEQYMRMIREGRIVPGAPFEVVRRAPAMALVDGHWGFGAVIAVRATLLAMEMARTTGVAAVSVRDCNHVSRLGHYVLMAAEAGLVGMMTANNHGGGRWVAPWGGTERRLSTNPLAFAAPTAGRPILVDITTSTVAEGKIRVLRNKGLPMPEGWAIHPDGSALTDPAHMYGPPYGSLLPFGGMAGHKGFGLSMMVELLSGALSGAGCTGAADRPPGNALFILVIDPAATGTLEAFQSEAAGLVDWVKSSAPVPGGAGVMAPGEPEFREEERRREAGIPLDDETWRQLRELAAGLSVPELECTTETQRHGDPEF